MNFDISYLFIAFIIVALQASVFLKINKSLFISPLIIQQATVAIALVTLLSLYNDGYMEWDVFLFLFFIIIIFAVLVGVLACFFPMNIPLIFSSKKIKKLDRQLVWFACCAAILLNAFYIIKLWSLYESGDDRLLLNRELRALSLLKDLFTLWSVAGLSLFYAIYKNNRYLMFLGVLALFISVSGSKAALLSSFLVFAFFYVNMNPVRFRTYLVLVFLVVIFLFFPTYLMYGGDFIEKVIYRISMSADVYPIAFVTGDYEQIYGYYDNFSYLMHPFSSLVGIRGYDYPLGAELIGTIGSEVTGTGPNPHLGLLALVLNDGSYEGAILLSSVVFSLLIASWCLITLILRSYYFGVSLRVIVFILYYTALYNVLIDIGAAQFSLVLMVLAFAIWFIFKFLSDIGKRNEIL